MDRFDLIEVTAWAGLTINKNKESNYISFIDICVQ